MSENDASRIIIDDSRVMFQWKGSNSKQSARWQHVSRLKASAFCIWKNKLWCFKKQQLILGTGTDIWWVTETHCGDVSLGWHQEINRAVTKIRIVL